MLAGHGRLRGNDLTRTPLNLSQVVYDCTPQDAVVTYDDLALFLQTGQGRLRGNDLTRAPVSRGECTIVPRPTPPEML